jgi:type I restriction enzyme R subunit
MEQATNNTKEQFANSIDLMKGIESAIISAIEAHSSMSKQALNSERLRTGLKDILLGPAQLYESLRARTKTNHTQSTN